MTEKMKTEYKKAATELRAAATQLKKLENAAKAQDQKVADLEKGLE